MEYKKNNKSITIGTHLGNFTGDYIVTSMIKSNFPTVNSRLGFVIMRYINTKGIYEKLSNFVGVHRNTPIEPTSKHNLVPVLLPISEIKKANDNPDISKWSDGDSIIWSCEAGNFCGDMYTYGCIKVGDESANVML